METIDCRKCSMPLFEKNVPESKLTVIAEDIEAKKTILHTFNGDVLEMSYICPGCGHKDAFTCGLKGTHHG